MPVGRATGRLVSVPDPNQPQHGSHLETRCDRLVWVWDRYYNFGDTYHTPWTIWLRRFHFTAPQLAATLPTQILPQILIRPVNISGQAPDYNYGDTVVLVSISNSIQN